MLVSAVLDPAAFDAEYFDALYTIQAEDFLHGISRNGILIVDSERRLQDSLSRKAESFPIKRNRLKILLTELLKDKSKRVAVHPVSLRNASLVELLDLAYHLKTDTKADVLIVGKKSLETLKTDRRFSQCVVPLAEYRDSDFEKDRRRYENGVEHIDGLPKSEVADLIIRAVRFTKWLRFYDAYIGFGENTSRFREGIEYILSLWEEHGFFASQQGSISVEIFTSSTTQVRHDETAHAKRSKLQRNQDNYRKINRELMERLKGRFPPWWQIKLLVKDDPDGIFHARYMETQHAVIGVERGFDLFKQNGEFQRNFFTLNMAARSHLKECRNLPDADFDNVP